MIEPLSPTCEALGLTLSTFYEQMNKIKVQRYPPELRPFPDALELQWDAQAQPRMLLLTCRHQPELMYSPDLPPLTWAGGHTQGRPVSIPQLGDLHRAQVWPRTTSPHWQTPVGTQALPRSASQTCMEPRKG